MTHISATSLRQNLYKVINQVNEESTPITITNTKGKGAVLIGEDDWAAIEETLYLMGVPHMVSSLIAAHNEPLEDSISEEDLEW